MDFVAKLLIVFTLMTHLVIGLDFGKDVEGKDCKVIEPIGNFTFDLGGLKRDLNPWIKSSDSPEQCSFNLCGPMSRKCNGQTAGACMKDARGKEVVIGITEKLFWNEGGIRFSFSDAKCNDKQNYTVNVMLHCDYTPNDKSDIGVIHPSDSCHVNIVMGTQFACLPIPTTFKSNCVVRKGGEIYNLNPLGNSNHIATFKQSQTFPNGTKFVIGICNPVLYGHEAACEPGTSVCRVDPKAETPETRYINMGMQTEDFSFGTNGQVVLKMPSSQPCDKKNNFSSIIHFSCDPDGHNNDIEYHSTAGCIHIFSFATPYVCSNKKSCSVQNAERNVTFDFSSLAGIQYEASTNNSEEKIKFSICADAGDPCIEKTGSCIVKGTQATNAGVTNDDLKLNEDKKSPYLLYTNGAVCKKQGQTYTTRIDFICADNSTDEGAVAIEDGCNITIHFKTLLACSFIKSCVGKDQYDEEIDLRPLIDFDGNYEATVNEKNLPNETGNVKYLLNVCRPLNSKYSLNCRGTSGACRTEVDKNGKHENEMTLGHPEYSLSVRKVNETKEVSMKYFEGAQCKSDPDEKITTRIRFMCDEKAGLGNPVLDNINGCEYEFDFPTNILCKERSIDLESKNKSCNLYNDVLSVSVDLKLFGDDGKFKVEDTTVDICGGGEKYYTIVYKQSMVRVEFQHENTDVEVRLKCSTSNSTKATKGDDGILVVHEGSLICPLLKITPKASSDIDPQPTPSPSTDNANESSSGLAFGYVFLISVVIVAFGAFYLVIRNPERREIIRNLIKFRSTSNVQYTRNVNEDDFILS